MLPLLALAAALCGGPAAAASDPALDCDNATTQADINQCAGQDYQRADAELIQLYAELMPRLDKTRQTMARTAQRVWLRYRDLQCSYEAAAYEGGSMEFMVHNACLARITSQRNDTLKDMLDQINP